MNMPVRSCITLLLVAVAGCGPSRPIEPAADLVVCKRLLDQYDQAEKLMAKVQTSGIGDDSAIRATERLVQISLHQQSQLAALQLLTAHRCPTMPTLAPTQGDLYYSEALSCESQTKVHGKKNPPECDIASWKNPIAAASPASAASR